jgi:outer membrane protein OmpA-like peptidoglycan-associated protein
MKISWNVEKDGTCVITGTPDGAHSFAPGTTIEIHTSQEGVVIFVVKDPSGTMTEAYYTLDGKVVNVYYIVINNNAPSQPPLPAPTVTETASPQPAPTVTVTSAPQPAPTVTVTSAPQPAPTVTVTSVPQPMPSPSPVASQPPVIHLSEQFHFDTNKYEVKAIDEPIVLDLAQAIIDLVDSQGDNVSSIDIQGYTDNVGGAAYNLGLSDRRANAVRDAVLKAIEDSAEGAKYPASSWDALLVAHGFGETHPIAGPSGHNAEGVAEFTAAERALNRRVEVHVNYK